MQDRELYSQILGIQEPWRVKDVELKVAEGEVRVPLTHDYPLEWPCAECGQPRVLYDHQPERRWRHLDTCQLTRFCIPNRRAAVVRKLPLRLL